MWRPRGVVAIGRIGGFGVCLAAVLIATACRNDAALPPLSAQLSGTLNVIGLAAPVRILRDRWGVPHVYAASRDDAFFAQGFVQAQDRLFQMELWRRSAEGKLAEVLGANFIERDAMTRRLQYRGDPAEEWASYGADTESIADAFVRGVNAWVTLARDRRPELFAVAGWPVVFWSAGDLLTRTDAFDRDGTIAAADAAALPPVVVDAVRRAAAPAFFTGLARPPRRPDSSDSAPIASTSAAPQNADAATYPSPSPHYLIHLHTPDWNAIGAALPWRPGILIGHDGHATFERVPRPIRAAVRAMPFAAADAAGGRVERDVIAVKGRAEPFISSTQITATGVVVATDRERGSIYELVWDGFKPGMAPAFASGPADQRADDHDARERHPTPSTVAFVHPLAITGAARALFNIGPFPKPIDGDPPFFVRLDQAVWDASRAMNAPGQSEDPSSPHFSDLARLWAGGQSLTLAFSDEAVNANAAATLTLVPDRRR